MKKLCAMVGCLILTAALSLTAVAANIDANEQKVLDKLEAGVTVSGKTVNLPAEYITMAENYLKRDDVSLTAEQSNTIVGEIDKAAAFIKTAGVTDLNDLTGAQKTTLLGYINAAADAAGVKVQIDSARKKITILDSKGAVIATVEPALKVTGADSTALVAVSVAAVLLLVGCVAVAKKARLFTAQ